jgi:hypothetical protein
MMEILLGSKYKELVLTFLSARNEGYAREISTYYNCDLSPVQNQLERLEMGAILVSKQVGRTRVYSFNQRYAFYKELTNLFKKVIEFLPNEEQERLLVIRKRPRRKGKPI